MRELVEGMLAGRVPLADGEKDPCLDFVVYGPRERAIGTPDFSGWTSAVQQGQVTVYGRTTKCAASPHEAAGLP